MSVLYQPTPTQRQAAERHRAFHASISARAAERLQEPAPVEEIVVAPPVLTPAVPTQELPPQAFPAEPDPPVSDKPFWFWVLGEEPAFNSVEVVQRMICGHFKISMAMIKGPDRTWPIVRPRQIAMWICSTVANKSYPEIGRRFGNRDHTTALAAVRRISKMMRDDSKFAETVNKLALAAEAKLFK
jgi:hypothetical protein